MTVAIAESFLYASSQSDVGLRLEGLPKLRVVKMTLREGLSQRTQAELEVASTDDLDFTGALGNKAEVSFDDADRRWTLRLSEAHLALSHDGLFHYTVRLSDPLWITQLTRNTRKFRNQTAQQIIASVLNEHHLVHRFELRRELAVRKYAAQYRETNLAFVERLLEFEGIFYRFEPDGTIVLNDWSPSAEEVEDGRVFELVEAAGALRHGTEHHGVHELRRGARVTSGRVTLADYNWKKSDVPLRCTGFADGDTDLEIYEYPAGYREESQGATLAAMRAEAYRAEAQFVQGRGFVPTFAAGFAFKLGGVAAAPFAGSYLLLRVEHRYELGASVQAGATGGGTSSRYENAFDAIPLERPFRPFPATPRPTVAGTHTAMVRGPAGQEIHTDTYGRFRAQLHWDRDATETDQDSRWLRMLQETSSSMVLARAGWEVFVGYIDGDPDRPIGLGRAINGAATPTYSLPLNKNMMSIQTPSSPATGGYSEIKMDDSAGSQQIALRAEKDLDTLVRDHKTELIGNDETHTVGADFKRLIGGNQTVTIGRHDTATYKATSELKVTGNRKLTVGGSESVDIGGGFNTTVTADTQEKVGSVRVSIVGSVSPPNFGSMAQSAALGLIPPQVTALQGLANANGQSLANTALNAAIGAGLDGKGPEAGNAALGAVASSLGFGGGSATSQGADGAEASSEKGFPGLSSLLNQYSASSIASGFKTNLRGAASAMTGGLSEAFMGTEAGQNAARKVQFGWDQLDALTSLFASGGVARTAAKSLRKMVGGAYVQASTSPISWGSTGVYMETIGGMKLTMTPRAIEQVVDGRMIVTVLGKILRTAAMTTSHLTLKDASLKVGGIAMYIAKETLTFDSMLPQSISAKLKFSLAGAESKIDLAPGSATIDCKNITLEALEGDIILKGKNLNLTKG